MIVGNRAKRARLTSTNGPAVLEYMRTVDGNFEVLNEEAYSQLFEAALLRDIVESGEAIGIKFAIFADPNLQAGIWNEECLEAYGFATYKILELELQEGRVDADDPNLAHLEDSPENGFRMRAVLEGFDSIPDKRRGAIHASEVFPDTLIWRDLQLEDHFLAVRSEEEETPEVAAQGSSSPQRNKREVHDDETDDHESSRETGSKGKFLVSAGKHFQCNTEASVKLKKKLDESLFTRRIITQERHSTVFREEGTVFLPPGEYIQKLQIIASQRTSGLVSGGATAQCWAGVEAFRLAQRLQVFQTKTSNTFDQLMKGEPWPILNYQKMSLDAFLSVDESRIAYDDMGQLIRKLQGLDAVLAIGGGDEWRGSTSEIITELSTGKLMSSLVEAVHYRINEAISIFVDTVRDPELDTVRRLTPSGEWQDFDLNSLGSVIAFFRNCLAGVQQDTFQNHALFNNTIKTMLTLSSRPIGSGKKDKVDAASKGPTTTPPLSTAGLLTPQRHQATTTQTNLKGGQKRGREGDSGDKETQLCINSGLYFLGVSKEDCKSGAACPYQHFESGSRVTSLPVSEVIKMAQKLPPFGGKKLQLLEALQEQTTEELEQTK